MIEVALLWGVGAAAGQELVLHGDVAASVAVERVTALSARAPSELRVVSLRHHLGVAALVVGAGEVRPCGSPRTRSSALRGAADEAEEAVLGGRYAEAARILADGLSALGCLDDVLEPELAARLYLLRGLLRFDEGDTDAAAADLAQARRIHPELSWDARMEPLARPLFQQADPTREARATLRVFPEPSVGEALWVDGVRVSSPVALPAGEHVVQYAGAVVHTVRFELHGVEDSTLVVPAHVGDDALTWVRDGARRDDLDTLLAPFSPAGVPTWIALPEQTWHRPGAGAWSLVATHRVPKRRRTTGNTVLGVGGGVMLATGGVLSAVGWVRGMSAYRDGDAGGDPTWGEYEQAAARHASASRQLWIGEALGGTGAVLLGVGLAVPLGGPGEPR